MVKKILENFGVRFEVLQFTDKGRNRVCLIQIPEKVQFSKDIFDGFIYFKVRNGFCYVLDIDISSLNPQELSKCNIEEELGTFINSFSSLMAKLGVLDRNHNLLKTVLKEKEELDFHNFDEYEEIVLLSYLKKIPAAYSKLKRIFINFDDCLVCEPFLRFLVQFIAKPNLKLEVRFEGEKCSWEKKFKQGWLAIQHPLTHNKLFTGQVNDIEIHFPKKDEPERISEKGMILKLDFCEAEWISFKYKQSKFRDQIYDNTIPSCAFKKLNELKTVKTGRNLEIYFIAKLEDIAKQKIIDRIGGYEDTSKKKFEKIIKKTKTDLSKLSLYYLTNYLLVINIESFKLMVKNGGQKHATKLKMA